MQHTSLLQPDIQALLVHALPEKVDSCKRLITDKSVTLLLRLQLPPILDMSVLLQSAVFTRHIGGDTVSAHASTSTSALSTSKVRHTQPRLRSTPQASANTYSLQGQALAYNACSDGGRLHMFTLRFFRVRARLVLHMAATHKHCCVLCRPHVFLQDLHMLQLLPQKRCKHIQPAGKALVTKHYSMQPVLHAARSLP